jgi:hypothetical protein
VQSAPVTWLVLAAVAAGCGGRPLDVGVASDAAPEAPAAEAATPPDAGTGVCASPDICSDDPAMSAVAGACVPDGDYWYCACADGFSINPKTNRCRAGTACVAAAADEWDFRMPFDASDCAARAPTACDANTHPGQDAVATELLALPGPKCAMPPNLTIRIEVVAGCPVILEGRAPNPGDGTIASFYLDYLHCLADAVGGVRLACAGGPDCVMAEWDTLAP